MRNLLLAGVAAFILASPAIAADAIVSEPASVVPDYVAFSWTGGYVGVHAGYGWGSTHDKNNPAAVKKDIDGFLGGIQAGYNHQLQNNIVLGVEADLSFGSVKDSWRDSNVNSGYFTEDKVNMSGSLRARLGYAMDRFLPYVTGGLAIASTKHTLGCDSALRRSGAGSCTPGSIREFRTSKSDTSIGYVVGGGAEYALTDNWTLRGEYLYTDLGKNKVTLVDPGFPGAISNRQFETKFSTVRLGVNYKF